MYFFKIGDQVIASTNVLNYEELTPNTTDAAQEKHVPVITKHDCELCLRVTLNPD